MSTFHPKLHYNSPRPNDTVLFFSFCVYSNIEIVRGLQDHNMEMCLFSFFVLFDFLHLRSCLFTLYCQRITGVTLQSDVGSGITTLSLKYHNMEMRLFCLFVGVIVCIFVLVCLHNVFLQ